MKKTVVRIVREHFGKSESFKGLNKDERDHFYSELYVFLVSEMRKTVQEMIQCEKAELHENVTIPAAQGERERDFMIEKQTGETNIQRTKRLAFEYSKLHKQPNDIAESYQNELLKLDEGNPAQLVEIAKFYLDKNNLEKAEQYLRDAYSFKIDDKEVAMTYACLLCQLNRSQEAAIILKELIAQGYETVKVNMLMSIAYSMNGDSFMAEKFKAISSLEQLRAAGRVPRAGH
jgi:predicted Zn-dependent protease